MMRRLIAAVLSLLMACGAADALSGPRRVLLFGAATKAGGGDAPQTTAFLARTSGLSPTETDAYKVLINGMVADGTFQLLDALYIFATNDITSASLNLISTSYTLTAPVGNPDFIADVGYAGNTANYLNTGFTPSTASGHFTLNSSSLGTYVQSSRAADGGSIALGCTDGMGSYDIVSPFTTGSTVQWDINDGDFPTASIPSSKGALIATRTGTTASAVYRNGSATAVGTSGSSSSLLISLPIWILGFNNSGVLSNGSNDRISASFIGGGLTGAQAASINNRINAYMTALGINVY